MKLEDFRWLAGLLEGEGAFMWLRRQRTLKVYLGMTDRDIMERARALIGKTRPSYGVNHKPASNRPTRKTMYVLYAHGARAAGLMMSFYTLMGFRRKAQIKKALTQWKGVPSRPNSVSRVWNHAD